MSLGGSMRPRYNTQVMTKFLAARQNNVGLAPKFSKGSIKNNEYWDADLQSYMYLQDFLKTHVGWMDEFTKIATRYGVPPQCMDPDTLDGELRQILDLAPEREERFMEVMDQDDADGAASYWLGMLQISPARHPATYLMVRLGRRIGEHVVMCLKGYFRSPRPSQLCPAIVPMIDPPATPAFPAGHAVQAYLISYLLAHSLPNIPSQKLAEEQGALFELADRVSQNRVVAGLHFPTDIAAGKAIGIKCFEALRDVKSVWGTGSTNALTEDGEFESKSLRERVRQEFPQYA
jgi:acid phosphatase (class A)